MVQVITLKWSGQRLRNLAVEWFTTRAGAGEGAGTGTGVSPVGAGAGAGAGEGAGAGDGASPVASRTKLLDNSLAN